MVAGSELDARALEVSGNQLARRGPTRSPVCRSSRLGAWRSVVPLFAVSNGAQL
jgi:hypothetical protein